MKNKIGILGLGARSTNYYTSLLHQKTHEYFGDYHTFPHLNYQINFNDINPFLPNQFNKLKPYLEGLTTKLEGFKVDKWVVPNITLHETLDRIHHNLSLFHPLKIATASCLDQNIKKIVILGTSYSMKSNYLKSFFIKNNIEILQVSNNDKEIINNLRIKIYNATENELDIKNYTSILEHYSASAHVVIACTELSLLHQKLKNDKIVDLVQLQVNETFNYYLKHQI